MAPDKKRAAIMRFIIIIANGAGTAALKKSGKVAFWPLKTI
jgi:hypothetical protein